MSRPSKGDIAQKLQAAQLCIVEKALIGFVEQIDGKVPTDEVILAEGAHCAFAPTEIGVYEKDGRRFSQFYVWRGEHVLALGFLEPRDLLTLFVAEVPRDEWPVALRLWVKQQGEKKEGA